VIVEAARAGARDWQDVPLAVLRAERANARRELELAQMRARQRDGQAQEALRPLRDRVHQLTEELIARYSADLTLVDSLLESSYPARVTGASSASAARPEVTG
jgi:hypothetical protein